MVNLVLSMWKVVSNTIIPIIGKTIDEAKSYAKKISPVDTWNYVESFIVSGARIKWKSIITELRNEDEKATGVEYWRRKSKSNRSKRWWSPQVEFWVGARVFKKVEIFWKKKFISNIKNDSK